MNVHVLQHAPFEDIGSIAGWLAARQVNISPPVCGRAHVYLSLLKTRFALKLDLSTVAACGEVGSTEAPVALSSVWGTCGSDSGECLRRPTVVAMMEAGGGRNGDDRADRGSRDRPRPWRVLGQREMRP